MAGYLVRISWLVSPPRSLGERNRALEEVVLESTNSDNKIAVIDVNGLITSEIEQGGMSLPDYIHEQLKAAAKDKDVKAVLLRVDSPGGEVLAADDINNSIKKFEESTPKPVVVSMGTLAASGGYYVSVPCRWIVANELTITGSIGVIMHGYNYRVLMDKVGVRPRVFKSGKYKDMLSGDREPEDKLDQAERKEREQEDAMVQALIDQTFQRFKDVVRTGRDWSAKKNGTEGTRLKADWQDYADGRILSGKQAMDLGFVDELGNFETATKAARRLAGISSAKLVQYRVPFDIGSMLFHLFGKSDAPALKVDLGFDLPRLQAGRLYFMMPTAVAH